MTDTKSGVAVIGSGSWATGLVKVLSENCEKIYWCIREKEIIDHLREHHHNPKFLRSVDFDMDKLTLTGDINEACSDAGIIILVVPSAFLKTSLAGLKTDIADKTICSAIKGIVPQNNTIVGEFMHTQYKVPYENLVVLSGPTHAEEIAMEKLSYLTVASLYRKQAKIIANLLDTHYLKTVISDDIFGTEYAAVMKNIYAISAGMAYGLGYGDNFQAVLLSNCAREMNRFVKKVYKNNRNITKSAYLGDLLVTAYSQFSRNRILGTMIGKGTSVKYALLNMTMVAEGYYAAESIHLINKEVGAKIPIAEAVYHVLYNEMSPAVAMERLTKLLK